MQVKHVYESYFLLEENHFLSDLQKYIFDSLLQHPLTRDTTFRIYKIMCQECM